MIVSIVHRFRSRRFIQGLIWIIDSLDPVVAFPVMGATFLVASIAGWYAGDLIRRMLGKLRRER
jgi:hypothetical protein